MGVIDIEPYLVARRYGTKMQRDERGRIYIDHGDGSGLRSVWGMVFTEEDEQRWAEEDAACERRRAAALREWEARRERVE
jgi:hypothetical protein